MKLLTEDKYLKFVIENYQNIKAFNQVFDQAKTNLPLCAGREVAHAILELKNPFSKRGLIVKDDGEGPWWADSRLYAEGNDTGPYFQFEIEKFKWEWLDSNDPDEAANLVLYVGTDGIKGRTSRIAFINKWAKRLKASTDRLHEKGIFLEENIDYREPYLAYRPLSEINVGLMADRDLFRKTVQRVVTEFTSALMPILRGRK